MTTISTGKTPSLCDACDYMHQWEIHERAGFVIFYDGAPCEWARELDTPHRNRPGCIAINVLTGERWVSTGGNYGSGAERWEREVA